MLSVTWYGHSNILLQENGVSVLIDPFFEGNPHAPAWTTIPSPDVIAVTHNHGDHLGQALDIAAQTGAVIVCIFELAEYFLAQGVDPSRIVGINIGGSAAVKGAVLTMTQAFHSSGLGSPAGFVVKMPRGHTVYHAGDTALFGDMKLIGEMLSVDLALLPVGGVFTMDARMAAEAAGLIGAPLVLPIHYATFPLLARNADAFVDYVRRCAPQCRVLIPKPCETVLVSDSRTDFSSAK